MTLKPLDQQIQFILEIDQLKSVLRRTSLINEARLENSAEHSWHIAVMAVLLADYANEAVNVLHVVKMLLVHDIVEIDAGDTFAYSDVSKADQHTQERLAAERIFGLLPTAQSAELMTLWEEFEAILTPEAKFANAMDRLMPTLHNYHNNGGTWQTPGVTLEKIKQRLTPVSAGSAELGQFVHAIVDDALARGLINPE